MSALLGGIVICSANALFYGLARIGRIGVRSISVLQSYYVAETAKLLFLITALALLFRYLKWLEPTALLAGFIATGLLGAAVSAALLIKGRHRD